MEIDRDKVNSENGFMCVCELHFSQMVKDLRKEDALAGWGCLSEKELKEDDKCDYPKCKRKAYFDVYWGDWGHLRKEVPR